MRRTWNKLEIGVVQLTRSGRFLCKGSKDVSASVNSGNCWIRTKHEVGPPPQGLFHRHFGLDCTVPSRLGLAWRSCRSAWSECRRNAA